MKIKNWVWALVGCLPSVLMAMPSDIYDSHLQVFSPDRTQIAFVRSVKKSVPENCKNLEVYPGRVDQIWILDRSTAQEKLVLESNLNCADSKQTIVGIDQLSFSKDGKTLYFKTMGSQEQREVSVGLTGGTSY